MGCLCLGKVSRLSGSLARISLAGQSLFQYIPPPSRHPVESSMRRSCLSFQPLSGSCKARQVAKGHDLDPVYRIKWNGIKAALALGGTLDSNRDLAESE